MQRHAKVLIQVGSWAKASKFIGHPRHLFTLGIFLEKSRPYIVKYDLSNLNPPALSAIMAEFTAEFTLV